MVPADPTPREPAEPAEGGEPGAGDSGLAFAAGERARAALDGVRRHLRAALDELEAMAGEGASAAARARAVAHLREAERQREVFGRATAHDLRNPLAAIRGQVQLLARRARRAEAEGAPLDLGRVRQGVDAIEAAVDRGAALLAELLDPPRDQDPPERDEGRERP
jgi:signal transduction histidine kinase